MSDNKTCFVISPIGEPDSEIRERSDKLLEYVIKPSVESHGYKPVRADEIAEPGLITSQVIDHVVESPLVIADLTGSNANVFYELAVRHAYQKPIIQLISSDENIPFDVAGTRTIQIDLSDIESAERAKSDIEEQIKNIESNNQDIETPISVALDLKDLRESTDPEERSMADIMETLSELRKNMVSIQNQLDEPEEILPPGYFRELTREFIMERNEEALFVIDDIEDVASDMIEMLEEDDSVDDSEVEDLEKSITTRLHRLEHILRRSNNEIHNVFHKAVDEY